MEREKTELRRSVFRYQIINDLPCDFRPDNCYNGNCLLPYVRDILGAYEKI